MAPVTVALALACRIVLNPFLHDTSPSTYFYMAIIMSAWLGGLGPGLTATGLSALAIDYFYLPPFGSILGGEIIQAISFLGVGAVISSIVARMRREQRRAEKTAGEARANETEARRAEARLRDTERRLTDIIEFLPDATFALDNAGRIIAWNKAMEELTGAPAVEVLGKGNHEYTYRLYGERIPCLADLVLRGDKAEWSFLNVIQEHDIIKAETYVSHLKPGGVWLAIKVAPIYDAQGDIVGVIDACRDITDRKRADETLQRQTAELEAERARWKGVVEGIADEVWICDAQGKMSLMNLPATTRMGLTEFRDKSVEEVLEELAILNPDGQPRPPEQSPLLRSLGGEIVRGEEIMIHRQTGKRRWRQFSSAPTRDASGAITGAVAITRDVTDLREAEAQLRLQAMALEAAANAIVVTDPDGTILWANPAFASMTGYGIKEVIGRNPRIMKSGEQDQAFYRAMWETIGRGEVWHGELINRRKDGTLYTEEMTIAPVLDERGGISHYIAIKQDISARKRIEDALQQSEKRFSSAFEYATVGMALVSPEGKWLKVNQATCDLLGYSEKELQTKTWQDITHPDDLTVDLGYVRQVLAGEIHTYQMEKRFFHKMGHVVWALLSVSLVRDHQGEPLYFLPQMVDITKRKRMEDHLKEADRRKDEFLAMLAHELRNPLAPIRYAVQLLNMNGLERQQLQKQRDVIDRQVSHMGRLLDDLLEVSRITRGKIQLKREIVDLRIVATHALDSMRPMIEGRGQHLLYEAPSSPLPVDGDPLRLEQIIRNLLHNANKYTEAGGCVKLSLGLDTDHGQEWRAVVRVSDSGIGITPEMLPCVFDLFSQAEQSIARSQGGLGIGLAMVKNLVQMHGGSVAAHSAGLGHGSEFVVRLPLATGLMGEFIEGAVPEEHFEPAPAKPRRVLVVDDNEDAAASLGELLELWGHEVRTAHDGRHALAAAQRWQPDIILLDIGLPGMDGYEIVRHLREDPATASAFLVALTGYGQEEDRRRAQEAGFNQHLTKPVELRQLQDLFQNT